MIPYPEDQPTVPLYPDAAAAFDMGRSAVYDSVGRGDFPVKVIRVGRALRVPTAELRRVLGLDLAPPRDAA